MRHLIREVLRSQRGKAAEIVEVLKTVDQAFAGLGCANGKLDVDHSRPMDTLVWQCEIESLNQFHTPARGFYANPDEPTVELLTTANANTVHGSREIYEVIK